MQDTFSNLYNLGWTHISLYNLCCIHICLYNKLETLFYRACRTRLSLSRKLNICFILYIRYVGHIFISITRWADVSVSITYAGSTFLFTKYDGHISLCHGCQIHIYYYNMFWTHIFLYKVCKRTFPSIMYASHILLSRIMDTHFSL